MNTDELLRTQEQNKLILTNIRTLCVLNHTSIPKIEKVLGYGNGSVSIWAKAKKRAPIERVEAIANYFNVSVDYLLSDHDLNKNKKDPPANADGYSEEEKELIKWYRALPDHLKPSWRQILSSTAAPFLSQEAKP